MATSASKKYCHRMFEVNLNDFKKYLMLLHFLETYDQVVKTFLMINL